MIAPNRFRETTEVYRAMTADDLEDPLEPKLGPRERALVEAARLAMRQLAGNIHPRAIRAASALATALEQYRNL